MCLTSSQNASQYPMKSATPYGRDGISIKRKKAEELAPYSVNRVLPLQTAELKTDTRTEEHGMTTTDGSIFSPEKYVETRLSIDEARPLPPEVYTSKEWYDREIETIFLKSWLVATREEEIPDPGDYVRIDIVGEPLVIVRDRDGVIRALSASCRHRGSELVTGRGNCRTLVCPYHAWTYSLTGKLLNAPSMQDARGFDKSRHNLPSIRAETWGGFVFINFDQDAPSLATSLGDLKERFRDYALEDMKVTKKWENVFNANWKIWVENSREGYHVGTVHRGSLNTVLPRRKGYQVSCRGRPRRLCDQQQRYREWSLRPEEQDPSFHRRALGRRPGKHAFHDFLPTSIDELATGPDHISSIFSRRP